jgi:hypothetical protein
MDQLEQRTLQFFACRPIPRPHLEGVSDVRGRFADEPMEPSRVRFRVLRVFRVRGGGAQELSRCLPVRASISRVL